MHNKCYVLHDVMVQGHVFLENSAVKMENAFPRRSAVTPGETAEMEVMNRTAVCSEYLIPIVTEY